MQWGGSEGHGGEERASMGGWQGFRHPIPTFATSLCKVLSWQVGGGGVGSSVAHSVLPCGTSEVSLSGQLKAVLVSHQRCAGDTNPRNDLHRESHPRPRHPNPRPAGTRANCAERAAQGRCRHSAGISGEDGLLLLTSATTYLRKKKKKTTPGIQSVREPVPKTPSLLQAKALDRKYCSHLC